jgi:hypothetical protein
LDTITACAPIRTQGEASQALALESSISVGALAALARVAQALVNVHTGLTVGSKLVTRVTNALEPAVHVDTTTVVAHPALGALVLVPAEAAV